MLVRRLEPRRQSPRRRVGMVERTPAPPPSRPVVRCAFLLRIVVVVVVVVPRRRPAVEVLSSGD